MKPEKEVLCRVSLGGGGGGGGQSQIVTSITV